MIFNNLNNYCFGGGSSECEVDVPKVGKSIAFFVFYLKPSLTNQLQDGICWINKVI